MDRMSLPEATRVVVDEVMRKQEQERERERLWLLKRKVRVPPFSKRSCFMRRLIYGTKRFSSVFEFEIPEDPNAIIEKSIRIKRVILAPEADSTELHLIKLQTKTDLDKEEEFPLAYLGQGTLQVELDITLSEPSVISLSKGKGPIYIIGDYAEEWRETSDDSTTDAIDDDQEVDIEEEEEEEEEDDEEVVEIEDIEEPENQENRSMMANFKRKRDGAEVSLIKKPRTEGAANGGTGEMDEEAVVGWTPSHPKNSIS